MLGYSRPLFRGNSASQGVKTLLSAFIHPNPVMTTCPLYGAYIRRAGQEDVTTFTLFNLSCLNFSTRHLLENALETDLNDICFLYSNTQEEPACLLISQEGATITFPRDGCKILTAKHSAIRPLIEEALTSNFGMKNR